MLSVENFMLFGTDEEPSSSLWMASLSEAMGESFREGMAVLDYGCGKLDGMRNFSDSG